MPLPQPTTAREESIRLIPGESITDIRDAFQEGKCFQALYPGAYLRWDEQAFGTLVCYIHHYGDRSKWGRRLMVIQRETSRKAKLPRWELHHWCDGVRKLVSRQYVTRMNAIEGAVRFAMNPEHR